MKDIKADKVLFFTYWYPNNYQKLSGIFIKEHALALQEYYNVSVFFVFSDPDLKPLVRFEVINDEGLTLFRYSHRKFSNKYLTPITGLLYLWCSIIGYLKITKIWGVANINHVHVLTRSALVPLIVKKLKGTPYYISEHWSRYLAIRNTYKGVLRKRLTKYVVKESSGISGVSADLKKAMRSHKLENSNFAVINNVVDTEKFCPDLLKKENKIFKFLHVSGLTDSIKNVSGILRVVKQLREENFNFSVDFIGNDPDRYSLEEYSNSLGLQDCAVFHGELYGDALVRYYQQADAFVMFSNFENQPCVLLESFCCGLPVIATKVGGIPEIVNNDNGVLVEAQDEHGLKDTMQSFLLKQVSFCADKIRADALQKYSYAAVAKQLIKLYNNR